VDGAPAPWATRKGAMRMERPAWEARPDTGGIDRLSISLTERRRKLVPYRYIYLQYLGPWDDRFKLCSVQATADVSETCH